MRSPRPTAYASPLPALVGAALLAVGGEAGAQSVGDAAPPPDASAAATDASTSDVASTPLSPEYLMHTGGVPMRTGGEAPRHGACACDVPRASGDPRHLAAVAAALAALAARRRRATASR
ncbi:MAG: hypothetical protein U0324_07360 [Polyangiales bacterium]